MKPTILVFADRPNWAYHEILKFILNNCSDEFDIFADFLSFNLNIKSKNPIHHLRRISDKFKYRKLKKDKNYDIVLYLGFYFTDEIEVTWNAKKIIKGIYTDGFPPQGALNCSSIKDFKKNYLNDVDAVVCGSQLITDYYSKHLDNVFYANMSSDLNLWKKKIFKKNITNKFIVGWTGNPNREFKGYYSHVIPAINLAKKKYSNIELKSRFSGPLESLPDFYNDVDVSLIASNADAGPASFAEASLTNTPSISTNIGLPAEVIQDGVNGFLVVRDIQEMANRIIELYENRNLLDKMSQRTRNDYLKKLGKEYRIKQWINMFSRVLEK